MSDDAPERAEPDPAPRRAGRAVPPIIDLKADAPKDASASGSSSARREESSAMFYRSHATIAGPLVLGALAGAIAGTVATFLIIALPTKSKDDVSLRLSTLEANQSLFSTADRAAALEQQNRSFDKKFLMLEESLTLQNQKIAELSEAQKALSEALASAQKSLEATSSAPSSDNLSEIMARMDTLNTRIDVLKSEAPITKSDEKLKLTTGLVILLSTKNKILKTESVTQEVAALKTLNFSFIPTDALQALANDSVDSKKSSVQAPQSQFTQNPTPTDWSDRLWVALSRLVTISPVEEKTEAKLSPQQDNRSKAVDQMITLVMDRLIAESATP
ncbi:MAG: hypothetical protein KGO21_08650 [Hyphomicrobiales bacterium]|nr:hypothetical protein [Hyphomicrobiales bacterium]